ncbi:MAG: hypothetical protein DCC67_02290 [Planctomycetota bacterium]|nr:MAG: hypothetical protein DCC67_02290 [Planctomycetota bacterium]
MSASIHARLDEETATLRDELRRRLGLSDTDVVREGIRALAPRLKRKPVRKFIGEGKHQSGVSDLASNKKHMEGFGES